MNKHINNKTAPFVTAWLFTLFFFMGLSVVGQSVNINNSNVCEGSGWRVVVPASGTTEFDYLQDPRVGSGSTALDIVGTECFPAAYIQFSDDGKEIAIRLRVNNKDGGNDNSSFQFKNFAYIGIDANMNGTIDFFLGVYSPSGNGRLGVYPADPAAQNSGPGVTGIAKPVATFQPIRGVNYSMIEVDYTPCALDPGDPCRCDDVSDPCSITPFSGDPDYFLTFKFNIDEVSNAIAGKTKENVTFDSNTPFTYIVGTSTQENSLNGDINGMDDKGPPPPNWDDIITPPVIADGDIFTVIFDKTIGDLEASPRMISVISVGGAGETLSYLPTPPKKRVTKDISNNDVFWEFDGWSTSYVTSNDTVYGDPANRISNEDLLNLLIDDDMTVYALWKSSSTQKLIVDNTVHFNATIGNYDFSRNNFAHATSVDGIVSVLPIVSPNPPSTTTDFNAINPGSGNNNQWTWQFLGWATDYRVRQTGTTWNSLPNIIVVPNGSSQVGAGEIDFYVWSQEVVELSTPRDNNYHTMYPSLIQSGHEDEPTVYAVWLYYRNNQVLLEVAFWDNIYSTSHTPPPYGSKLHTVSFYSGSGLVFFPSNPTRQGYIFRGWDSQPNASPDGAVATRYNDPIRPPGSTGGSASLSGVITGDLYAVWQPENLALLFDANTVDINGKALIGTPAFTSYGTLCTTISGIRYPAFPGTPSMNGYIFQGWNTDPQGFGYWAGEDPVSGMHYFIDTDSLIKFSLLETYDLPMTIGGQSISGYTRIYAVWERDPYEQHTEKTVRFDAMGGLFTYYDESKDPPFYNGENHYGEEHQLLDVIAVDGYLAYIPTPVWPDLDDDGEPLFIFAGWSFDDIPDRVVDPTINSWTSHPNFLNDGTVVYAVWKEVITITFYPVGGVWPDNTSDPIKVATDDEGLALYIPGFYDVPDYHPNRENFDFQGWYTGYNGTGTNYSRHMIITKPMNVYAKWYGSNELNYVFILFDFNDGATPDSLSYLALSEIINDFVVEPEEPVRDGYSFKGWWLVENSSPSFLWDFNSDEVSINMVTEYGVNILRLRAMWTKLFDDSRKFLIINKHINQKLKHIVP